MGLLNMREGKGACCESHRIKNGDWEMDMKVQADIIVWGSNRGITPENIRIRGVDSGRQDCQSCIGVKRQQRERS